MGKKSKKHDKEEKTSFNFSSDEKRKTKLPNITSGLNEAVSDGDSSIIKKTNPKKNKKDNSVKIMKISKNKQFDNILSLAAEEKLEQETNNDSNKKTKKRKHSMVNIEHDEEKTSSDKKKKRKLQKDMLLNQANDEDSHEKADVTTTIKIQKTSKKESIAVDPDEVAQKETKTNNSEKSKKKKNRKIVEEQTFDDEDIDKYCEELDEIHNKQYEDWVKLIEDNLNSNKKDKVYY